MWQLVTMIWLAMLDYMELKYFIQLMQRMMHNEVII